MLLVNNNLKLFLGTNDIFSPLVYNPSAFLLYFLIGAPLIIHPGRDEQSPFDILDILEAAGADLSRTVMSHLDRTVFDDQRLLELAKRGCYLEYDLFGMECSHFQVLHLK